MGVKVTTDRHSLLRLRIYGAVHPLFAMPLWHAQETSLFTRYQNLEIYTLYPYDIKRLKLKKWAATQGLHGKT